ncbi:MAG: carbohydrate-binding domain-containing protein [Candidatus Coproplasma sp.]
MKNKMTALIFACAFLTSIATSAACSIGNSNHTHTYSDEWTYDEIYHWHSAECVHLNETKDKAEHTFDEGTETNATFESAGYMTYGCTVCGYEKQVVTAPALEHNYLDTLTHDNGDTHWYACIDEGYESLKKGEESHNLIETDYDEVTGYATYACECGFSKRYLRTAITEFPTVSNPTVYIGQKLSDITLTGGTGSVDGTFVWSAPDTVITASGNYNVTFVPTDTSYAPISGMIAITATQLSVAVTVGENGSASATGTVNVDYGGSLTVTFTPDSGYILDSLTVDGNAITPSNSYTLTNITENHTVCATFVEQILPFTLTCVSGTPNAYTFENNVLTFTTIDAESVYAISGEFDGNIVFDVGDTYKFDLEMRGFTLTCDYINPIMILSGDEVTLTAKKGYDNYIYDRRAAVDSTDETVYSAAVYSFVDLQISGKGSLTLVSENNNGIHTKDDLQIKNLTLSVTCVDNALKGNDSVEVTNATTTLIAKQGDCIKTSNSHISETTGNQKGTISIAGGTHNLYAACDGIDAAYNVLIDDSTTVLNIYTDKYSEYSEEVTAVSEGTYYLRYTSTSYKYSIKYYNSDSDYLWVNVSDSYEKVTSSSQGGRPGQSSSTYYYYTFAKNANYSKLAVYMYTSSQAQGQDTDYYACSDYKTISTSYDTVALSYSAGSLSVSWTNYTTTSSGGMGGMGGMQEGNTDKGTYSTKGIKAANEITINAGTIYIKAYDDAIHANNDGGTLENGENPTGNVNICGGTITVYSNDDGIHADGTLTIIDGSITVTNAYEGLEGTFINIQGGDISVVSSDDGVNATTTSGYGITITGGTMYVYASGDGLDSNSKDSYGGILFAGGKTVVICNSNGNSAIDTESGYTHTGGLVVAIMTTGGMTSESSRGNSTGMTTKSSISLSNGGYLTVTVDSVTVATVQMPCAMTAYVVYLGSSSATIGSATSSSLTLDSNGVYWS